MNHTKTLLNSLIMFVVNWIYLNHPNYLQQLKNILILYVAI